MNEENKVQVKQKGAKKKGPGKWFNKIPKDFLLSPGGVILMIYAGFMEIIDLIPIPGADSLTWELALEIPFIILLIVLAKVPIKSMIIPFVLERIPVISDIVPTWIIRMFA